MKILQAGCASLLVATASAVVPIGAQAAPASKPSEILQAVSCASADFCAAVGIYDTSEEDTPDDTRNLAQMWDGTSWHTIHVPAPAKSYFPELNDVSCSSAVFCMALGFDEDSLKPYAARWDGTSWSVVHTDRAAPANQPLDAIDCVSRTMCVAVGTAYSGGHTYAAAERWNGTSWHLMSVPQPAKHLSRASGISCPSTTSCALVGQYRVSARGAYRAFAAIWRHGKWTRSHVAVPATKAPPDSGLSDVSCVSGRRCVAVGGYSTDDADEGRSLFEQWDGSRWTPMHTSSELATASPTSISCTARHHCVAMSPPSGTGGQQSFVLSGSSWHIEPFAGPATNWLRGLDCVSARACFAVGLREGANRDRTLAEYRGPAWRVVTTP